VTKHDDFEREAQPGLPEPLPAGESVVWQGSPDWRSLARRAFHCYKVAGYFLLLAVWFAAEGLHDGVATTELIHTLGILGGLGVCSVGLLALLAWGSAREAIYTVTQKRVVMRFGVALRLTLNVPFRIVDAVAVKRHADGSGDIALALGTEDRVSYLVLWPHARPWRLRKPELTLRCIPDVERVAQLISWQLGAGEQPAVALSLSADAMAT
jgi:hypothetical protein